MDHNILGHAGGCHDPGAAGAVWGWLGDAAEGDPRRSESAGESTAVAGGLGDLVPPSGGKAVYRLRVARATGYNVGVSGQTLGFARGCAPPKLIEPF